MKSLCYITVLAAVARAAPFVLFPPGTELPSVLGTMPGFVPKVHPQKTCGTCQSADFPIHARGQVEDPSHREATGKPTLKKYYKPSFVGNSSSNKSRGAKPYSAYSFPEFKDLQVPSEQTVKSEADDIFSSQAKKAIDNLNTQMSEVFSNSLQNYLEGKDQNETSAYQKSLPREKRCSFCSSGGFGAHILEVSPRFDKFVSRLNETVSDSFIRTLRKAIYTYEDPTAKAVFSGERAIPVIDNLNKTELLDGVSPEIKSMVISLQKQAHEDLRGVEAVREFLVGHEIVWSLLKDGKLSPKGEDVIASLRENVANYLRRVERVRKLLEKAGNDISRPVIKKLKKHGNQG